MLGKRILFFGHTSFPILNPYRVCFLHRVRFLFYALPARFRAQSTASLISTVSTGFEAK
jgi:hypothetical protein